MAPLGDPEAARPAPHQQKEAHPMSNDNQTQWEDRLTDDAPQIANMDEIDFMTMLMECRIIQAS